MLRLVDIISRTSTGISFRTEELLEEDLMIYVIYDSYTNETLPTAATREDYIGWRVATTLTSTGATAADFVIDNTTLYPTYTTAIPDYTLLSPKQLYVMSFQEYQIIHNVITRFDLVRKRIPNPGYGITSANAIGQNGTVSFAGGHEKKMTVGELGQMMEGAMLELNGTPPRTSFWPIYATTDADKIRNPYMKYNGIPQDIQELIQMGTLLRCLISTGLLEVDISFSTSDSGLQLTFERVSHVKGWFDALLADYKEQKTLLKWNYANHGGVGVGTIPWTLQGPFGTLMNNASYGGSLALSSVLGFTARGNVPL